MRTTILNTNLLDTDRMELVGQRHLVLEDGRIREVSEAQPTLKSDRVIDARGRVAMPGFIDAHVHHVITTMDFHRLQRLSTVERALGMAQLAEAMLQRGFTTVRDVAGDTGGLVRAIRSGLCNGPRIIRSGRALSQTGGHGDLRSATETAPLCACQIHHSDLGVVADGVEAVRLAAREELRRGADFIKIMSSGGVASPTDPFDSIQYTAEEVRAITTETDHRHTYTTSHAYQPEAIRLAIDNGVRCIEHGNLLDADTAARMVELGVTMVPTLVTYKAMAELGAQAGMPKANLEKNRGVFEQGLASIDIARSAGVELGFGTDLLGEAQPWQSREFAIRRDLQPAREVLRSVYTVNARLCGLAGKAGALQPEAHADVLLTWVDPLDDLSALADPATLDMVVAGGRVVVDRLG